MANTTNALTGYQSITVHCDNEQAAFLIERLNGTRISIRIGKTALFLSIAEAAQVVEAITSLISAPPSQTAVH
ncbi:MAG: hypothetical protein IPN91_03580 [Holophagaceae bacterium]|uniref:Uncharacterized protein n=1 Tax=Candidatus Geothrix odensensis TaxID=2954440 RepID=A0A936F0V9_9BACT|nr:hypothetical protein [Candidatus Geothrix odensensis]